MTRKTKLAKQELPTKIPLEVLKDTRLSTNEKLLYGVILTLKKCSRKNCFAHNQYFANLFHVHPRTIQRWLAKLQHQRYILRQYKKPRPHWSIRTIKILHKSKYRSFTLVDMANYTKSNPTKLLLFSFLQTSSYRHTFAERIPFQYTTKQLQRRLGCSYTQVYNAIATQRDVLIRHVRPFPKTRGWLTEYALWCVKPPA